MSDLSMSQTQRITRPRKIDIPAELFRPSRKDTFLILSKAILMWLLPMIGVSILYGSNVYMNTLAAFISFVFGAQGWHLLGLAGHDGTHFNLHQNRFKSARIGVWISSMVPLHFDIGLAVSHAAHHRYINTDRDPDNLTFGRFRNILLRAFVARLVANRKYFDDTVLLATNRWPKDRPHYINLTRAELSWLAKENLFLGTVWIAIYTAVAIHAPTFFVLAIALPYSGTVVISSLRPYFEHAGVNDLNAVDQLYARSWINPVFDLFFGGVNYHEAHHRYPGVPSSKIKQLHDILVAQGVISPDRIVTSLPGLVRSVMSDSAYGAPKKT